MRNKAEKHSPIPLFYENNDDHSFLEAAVSSVRGFGVLGLLIFPHTEIKMTKMIYELLFKS